MNATAFQQRTGALLVALSLVGCQTPADKPATETKVSAEVKTSAGAEDKAAEAQPRAPAADEDAHHVVFADRLAYSYVLLLDPETPPDFTAPTRAELQDLIRAAYPGHERDEEVRLLLVLAEREIASRGDGAPELELPTPEEEAEAADAARDESRLADKDSEERAAPSDPLEAEAEAEADEGEEARKKALRVAGRTADLVGLELELERVEESGAGDHHGLIPKRFLFEPDDAPLLTRALSPADRASLARRRWQLVLRVGYRNRNAVRGLRLLQALVRVVAREHDALIYDPDTHETVDLETFKRRRLQIKLGNIADQIVVVPFPDDRHGAGHIRLATRGMRRFGSVDLELDGLPRDPALLQSATHLLHGLAFQMVTLGVLGETGFATELDDTVTIHYRDCAQAYAGRGERLPRCHDCPESVLVHLVERPPEAHDPAGHVVARVVAPRTTSDRPEYDHPAWARDAVTRVLGSGSAE